MSRRHARAAVLAVVAGLAALAGCGGDAEPAEGRGTVRVAAAADLKFALDEVVGLAEDRHPGLTVKVTYGSSGTFLQQIQNGAPFDLYLSADLSYPRELVDAGLAEEDDLFRYAVGRLVLWVPESSPVDPRDGLEVLAGDGTAKVAVANPEHAPYGVAAVAALREAGVYDAVAPKLVLGENVAQAAEFVQSGNADAGIEGTDTLVFVVDDHQDRADLVRQARKIGYDVVGRKEFESYPAASVAEATEGLRYEYDALDRPTATMRTADRRKSYVFYEAPEKQRTQDFRQNETTSVFRSFGSPSYESLMSVSMPYSAIAADGTSTAQTSTMSFVRDTYGFASSATHAGVTRRYGLDDSRQVVKEFAPELGAATIDARHHARHLALGGHAAHQPRSVRRRHG